MARDLKTAGQIRDEVSRLIHDSENVKQDEAEIGVPEPTPLQEPDGTGCNWTMMYFQNAAGYANEVANAVQQVMAKWNVK